MSDTDIQVGTCRACGQELILTADDCWHPYNVVTACPPETPNEYGTPRAQWGSFGRPGRQYFIPNEVQPTA